ncbi:FAD synthase [Candidatus Micrarchaeota archaeon CG_4_10_14_0_2_um_filter_49_7]|nr:MAG: FAD synthase [Candidatus Micrarchaeota archaeon CG_4_10_14_0_2_um_filter_49_7]HII53478.1 adenylyltransferase/cytidyltransferase family protein [Candidatus Micrarchaeota archaeon]
MKETLKRLIILEIKEDGISPKTHSSLPENEKKLLFEKNGRFFVKPGERKKIRVVATGGVFDIIHLGHVYTLKMAKELGDLLVVVVASDKHTSGRKKLAHNEDERRQLVESVRHVDLAIIGEENKKKTVGRIKPDVIAFGYDQKPEFEGMAEIVRIESAYKPEVLKSRKILETI